jgi:hypothetical protein
MAAMGGAAAAGWFPIWKSSRLSPDSIQRRGYWFGTALCVLLLFLSQLPDLKSAVIISVAIGLGMVGVAFRWTRHIKISGRIYAASPSDRRADRPPALGDDR